MVMAQVCFDSSTFGKKTDLTSGLTMYYKAHPKQSNGEQYVSIGVRADHSILTAGTRLGWLSVALSANGGMRGADIWLLTKNTAGNWILEDRFSSDMVTPTLDAQQDLNLINAQQTDAETCMIFQRRVSTCDVNQADLDFSPYGQYVIYAFSTSSTFAYHGPSNRGSKRVNFLTTFTAPALPADVQTLDIKMKLFNVPSADTSYMCQSFVLPNDKKYHIIRADPLVGQGQHRVHHMIMYTCLNPVNMSTPTTCGSMHGCQSFTVGWAVGGGNNYLPDAAGIPMGNHAQGGAVYVLLQVHYDNPQLLSNIKDDSGFRLYYTDKLRANDAGVLTIGYPTDYLSLPPALTNVSLTNTCPSECTVKLPNSGITVFGNGFHAHKYGRKFITRIIRNNVELEPLGVQPWFSFNHQGLDPVSRVIMPGDRLITEAVYDTTGATTTITGGESTSNEMMFDFVQYYPKPATPIYICLDLSSFKGNYEAFVRNSALCVTDYSKMGSSDILSQIVNRATTPAYTPYVKPPSTCVLPAPAYTERVDVSSASSVVSSMLIVSLLSIVAALLM